MTASGVRLERLEVVLGGRTVLAVEEHLFPGGAISSVEGENGSGKTTLLLAAAGLLDLARGRIWLGNRLHHLGRAPAPAKLRQRMALALQEPYFFAGRVRDNVVYGLKCRGIQRNERERRMQAALERLGASEWRDRPIHELSGGEKKLVDLARTLICEPEVVLLDEPTAALDPLVADRVENLLRDLACAGKTTIIFSTHNASQAERLAESRLRLKGGHPQSGAGVTG